jgi:epoxyqueuosine reductase
MVDAGSIRSALTAFVASHPGNRLENGDPIYDEPLVGVACAADPYFTKLREPGVIGDVFRLPYDWLDGASSIVSYFLPFSEAIRRSNRPEGDPSVEWLHARFRGEALNNEAKRFVVSLLEKEGAHALAPTLDPRFAQTQDFRSNWSERHVAFIAGLGTFGLSRGLITAKGIAGRFGSVVTDLTIAVTARPYKDPFEYCLFLSGKAECNACQERCPAGAISREGKSHPPCSDYLRSPDLLKDVRAKFGYTYSGCGKCQTAVPCEDRIPGMARP